jgi:dTDP-4-amino-4,6-dideoxygalactose transaminase
LRDTSGLQLPHTDEQVLSSSGYVMPIFLEDPDLQPEFRERLLDRHRIQTSVLYPPIHLFSAYRDRFPTPPLPKTELAGRTAVMLPMFGHLTDEQQERVAAAVREELAA